MQARQVEKVLSYSNQMVKKGNPQEAEKVLSEAISRAPHIVDFYYSRAIVRGDYLNKHGLAFRDYSVVIKRAPEKFPKAFYRRGDIFAKYEKYENAVQDYSICLKRYPKYGKVYFKRAKAFYSAGYYLKASKDLERCIHYSPKYKDAVDQYRKKHHL
jgi:tetratricopeptide (TPR) repeat protein